jgi:threonine synthase
MSTCLEYFIYETHLRRLVVIVHATSSSRDLPPRPIGGEGLDRAIRETTSHHRLGQTPLLFTFTKKALNSREFENPYEIDMQYISTRKSTVKIDFSTALVSSLACNGGLYMPESIPTFSHAEIKEMASLSYVDLTYKILQPFVGNAIDGKILKNIIAETYNESNFRDPEIAPLKKINDKHYLLELFHGPTLAFKDFALQLLGRLLHYVLEQNGEKAIIIGATSGDTGSAAIEGCIDAKNVDIFILHPHNRISDIQRKQMTTIDRPNVHNIALEGNFDDCQEMVKAIFREWGESLDDKTRLIAVNSINWVRIAAQIVYYFYTAAQLGSPEKEVSFSVPTGNFGDVFAGYIAKKMGLPIKRFIIATNENNILDRFLKDNKYTKQKLQHTLSPSMDIQVSNNFERLLFDMYGYDGDKINEIMTNFKETGNISVDDEILGKLRAIFLSHSLGDDEVCQFIKKIDDEYGMIIDPHSAIGLAAAMHYEEEIDTPIITLATAHPAKFPQAMQKAGLEAVALPEHLKDLESKKEIFSILPNDKNAVEEFIKQNIKASGK